MNNLRKERAVADHYTYYVPLEFSSDLVEAAHTRCEELISDFSHSSPSGIDGWCENIYWASYDAAASRVYNTWYNSSGHYNNMIYGCEASGVYCLYCGIGIMLYDGELFAVYLVNGSCPGTPPASGYVEPVAPPPEETTSSDSGTPDETTEGGT